MILLSSTLIGRLFYLQIIKGEEYQDNYSLKIQKPRILNGSRGNIYDRNGNLLAYNELANSVTIEDNGSYDKTSEKNEALNTELYNIIKELDKTLNQILHRIPKKQKIELVTWIGERVQSVMDARETDEVQIIRQILIEISQFFQTIFQQDVIY